ncbi:MAG: hypothetical protein NUV76_12405 [Candidatus Kuenenia sp.]|nr:hypothetical protein [Candidatus Kuenenia sp.]
MFINSVLQKYPELKRPEALFDINNIVAQTEIWENGFVRLKQETFDSICKIPITPPFKTVWYELNSFKYDDVFFVEGMLSEHKDDFIKMSMYISGYNPHSKIRQDYATVGTVTFPISENLLINFPENSKCELERTDVGKREYEKVIYLCACKVFFANALLNCKNVSTDSHIFPNRRSIQHYKRIGKPYFEKYYTLKLEVPGSKKRSEIDQNVESDGSARAFHICRGHFKIYTEANPLFGKYTGTFWWNSQVRGDIKTGIIDKNYELKQL